MRIQATPKYPLGIAEPESGVHRALIGQRGLENYPITNFEGPNGYCQFGPNKILVLILPIVRKIAKKL